MSSFCKHCLRQATGLRTRSAIISRFYATSSRTFADLGLPPVLLAALQQSFPHVQTPTASQEALLKALIPSNDVHAKSNREPNLILRDLTGSGKSLALLLGLLSQRQHRRRKKIVLPAIQQLLLVPHTELARQFEYWLELLNTSVEEGNGDIDESVNLPHAKKPKAPALLPAQTIYRGAADLTVRDETSLLVATPNVLQDVIDGLNLTGLKIIALDEADSMISPPGRFATRQEIVKWERHPPLLLSLMERLLRPSGLRGSRTGDHATDNHNLERRIIATSATANSVFRDWLVRRSGWLGTDREANARKQMDWYDFERDQDIGDASQESGIGQSVYQIEGKKRMPQAEIQHYLVKVGEDAPKLSDDSHSSAPATSTGLGEAQNLFIETAATIFATEEVVSGLLLIGSGQSLNKTLEALRDLQVPAATITEGKDLPSDEPRLYVHSVDAVRGLDIPNLSHVFLLPGLAEDANSYLHVAGRVGRLTAGGKRRKGSVYCLVNSHIKHEELRVHRCWELLGIDGHRYEGE